MLETITYCPILHARVAELKALEQLSTGSKGQLFPVIVWRPWPNAKSLERTGERVIAALGDRPFALDLDRTKHHSSSTRPAQAQFDKLFDPADGFSAYYEHVAGLERAVPVLRPDGLGNVDRQLEHVEGLERGAVVRLSEGSAHLIDRLAEVVAAALDVVLVIDAGWSRDLLGREAWASTLIERALRDAPGAELVVSGSSFPDSFTNAGERRVYRVDERHLYSSLVRRHNQANIVYGDWGSTRPPSDPAPMRNVPRIDLPLPLEWISFRQDSVENYSDIAQRMMGDDAWPQDLDIWGTYAIACTAEGMPGAIRSPNTAAAVRINIHLHRQSNFGVIGEVSDDEEPYLDE